MYNNYHRSPVGQANIAGIYRLNENMEVEPILEDTLNYRVSNCICFPGSGDKMFFCDTPTRKIYSFDYPLDRGGKLTNRQLVWTMPSNLPGGPDGAQVGTLQQGVNRNYLCGEHCLNVSHACVLFLLFHSVDADGFIWAALSGASRVVRINPSIGEVDLVVHLPVKSPTSVTFGGPDLDELFITTRGPDGGGLYRVKLPFGIRGLPEPEYKVTE
jgi:sugar lactone lactonase YvrE